MNRILLALLLSLASAAAQTEITNEAFRVSVNNSNMTWSVVWSNADVALNGMSFAVEIDEKTLKPQSAFTDVQRTPTETAVQQSWTNGVEVTRWLRIPTGTNAVVTLSARIVNRTGHDVSLGTQHLIDLYGTWHVGDPKINPASVYIVGSSELQCQPAHTASERNYHSSGFLSLANKVSNSAFVIGFLTAAQARPDLDAQFRVNQGGQRLLAHQPFLGRKLAAGETLELDPVYLAAHPDPYAALEHYGDAAAKAAAQPVRTKPTALWCSWYAHRMALSEDLVLSNAVVAAKYLKPLGFEIMQLDHGWQRGDVTGDWVPNERFPHGLRWLSDELKSRYGLRLGAWIAPTDVAENSETFKTHPDWMLKGADGKPLVNWKWYWKPNPNCYELDASNPAVQKWIEQTFAQLTSWGVSYYKIDFIAASAGEHFVQSNPNVTRGWGVMRNAMEALRRGAGHDAWIRYCQTPPLLSAGLADSVIGGTDTLDAGLNGNIDVLRTSARSLAAGYWLNDRLYHREICDMSVRMQADLEEARLRLAIMTLGGCSISFSDELRFLPLSRIRMMQACLPPGNPPMKPLDLFERELPSVWWIHCRNDADEWDVVGLFNFENRPEARSVDFAAFGYAPGTEKTAFEFWEQKFLGLHTNKLTLTLPPQSSRIIALHRTAPHPQVIATDLHLLQGFHELKALNWDDNKHVLSGECERMPDIQGRLLVYVPKGFTPHFEFPLTTNSAALTHVDGRLWAYELTFNRQTEQWRIPFDVEPRN